MRAEFTFYRGDGSVLDTAVSESPSKLRLNGGPEPTIKNQHLMDLYRSSRTYTVTIGQVVSKGLWK